MAVRTKNLFWTVCLAGILGVIGATRAGAQTNLIYHRFRFFLHPDLAAGLSSGEIKSRLALYVQDLNTIFGKNTLRRFTFNPEADLSITNAPPPIDYYGGGALPETNYEVWAIANPAASTPYPYSHGGYMSSSTNGAGVAAGLYWDAVHDRTTLTNADPYDWDLWNYWLQIHNIAHELGHVFGAGSGEYYSLRNVQDTTGAVPLENIYYTDFDPTTDPYWSQRPDYWTDPMLIWTPRLSWTQLISQVRFANVTAAMVNAGYRSVFPLSRYVPDLSATRVLVVAGGPANPLANTPVKAWKVMAAPPYTAQLVFDGSTSSAGAVQFNWDGQPDNFDNLILLKAWPPTAPAVVKWFSFYDAEEQRMVFGKTNLNIYLLVPQTNPPPALTIRAGVNGLVIGWPVEAAGYLLESAPSLDSPEWQTVNQVTTTNGTQREVNWTNIGGARFFRLRQRLAE